MIFLNLRLSRTASSRRCVRLIDPYWLVIQQREEKVYKPSWNYAHFWMRLFVFQTSSSCLQQYEHVIGCFFVFFFWLRTLFPPFLCAGVCKTEEDEGPSTEEDSQAFRGVGVCKWFNVRMGFGFLSMTSREGVPLDEPVDVFVHQVGPLSALKSWKKKKKHRYEATLSKRSAKKCWVCFLTSGQEGDQPTCF